MRQEYLNAEQRQARARLAAARRHHPDQPELAAEDLAVLQAAKAERAVQQAMATVSTLPRSQRMELARRLLDLEIEEGAHARSA
jgi:hypothetical protein